MHGGINQRPCVEKNKPICVFKTQDDDTEAKTEKKLLLVKGYACQAKEAAIYPVTSRKETMFTTELIFKTSK